MAVGVYSTIPLVIEQLLITLAARKAAAPSGTGLQGVLILDGLPASGNIPSEREVVCIDDPINVVREWAGIGQLRIDEAYDMRIVVDVIREGNDRAACRQRFFEVVAEIEQAAVRDITLAGILNWGVKPGPMDPTCIPFSDAAWHANATLNLHCSGRIQAT